jgi:hypothetical protein
VNLDEGVYLRVRVASPYLIWSIQISNCIVVVIEIMCSAHLECIYAQEL